MKQQKLIAVKSNSINVKYKVQEITHRVGQINIAVILKEHDTCLVTYLLTTYLL